MVFYVYRRCVDERHVAGRHVESRYEGSLFFGAETFLRRDIVE